MKGGELAKRKDMREQAEAGGSLQTTTRPTLNLLLLLLLILLLLLLLLLLLFLLRASVRV
jgi:hypothetical protein